MDNEVTETGARGGTGNSYDYGARMYNSRLGRWFSLDPLKQSYPNYSSFSFALLNPLVNLDFEGKFVYNFDGNVSTHITLDILYETDLGKKLLDNYKDNENEHIIITFTAMDPKIAVELCMPIDLAIFRPIDFVNSEGVFETWKPIDAGWHYFEVFDGLELPEGINFLVIIRNDGTRDKEYARIEGQKQSFSKIGTGEEENYVNILSAEYLYHAIRAHYETNPLFGKWTSDDVEDQHDIFEDTGEQKMVREQMFDLEKSVIEDIRQNRINQKNQINAMEKWQPINNNQEKTDENGNG